MKVCPECHATYDDRDESCARDGALLVAAALPKNPLLHEVLPVASTEATSMIDLEALEQARREQMKARGEDPDAPPAAGPSASGEGAPLAEDHQTEPPEEEDPEATGFLDAAALQRMREAEQAAHAAPEEGPGRGNADEPSALGHEDEEADDHGVPPESEGDEANEASLPAKMRAEARDLAEPSDAGGAEEDDGATEHDDYARSLRESSQYAYAEEYTSRGAWSEEATVVGATQGHWAPASRPSSLRGWLALGVLALGGFGAFSAYELWHSGMLTVSTLPPGALVRLDGEVLGPSPMQRRVPVGPHALKLELEGYQTVVEALEMTRSGLPLVISLQPALGGAIPAPAPATPGKGETATGEGNPAPTDGGVAVPPIPADEAAPAPEVLVAQAEDELAAGALDAAFATAKRLLAAHPGDRRADALLERIIEARIARSDTRRKKDETDRSAGAGKASRMTPAARAKTACADGLSQYQAGEVANAKTSLQKCVQLSPRHAEAHRTLARIYEADGQVERTRYHLERYLAVGGIDPDFRVRRWLEAHPARAR